MQTMIQLKNISKTFGTGDGAVAALRDVSIDIHRGEIFGVIGLSGAGKSTLVRCINLLERPDEGAVIVDGQELTKLPTRELNKARKSIGMIFQYFNLLMQRTVLENICFPLELAGVPRKKARARARELLSIVDLSDKENAYPAQLSGGQKQRVAIVRALAMNPEVLLFDEPTSALDPEMVGEVQNLMRELAKDGMTMLVVSHDTDFAMELADRIVFLADGKVLVDAPPSVIAASDNPRIRDFFSLR